MKKKAKVVKKVSKLVNKATNRGSKRAVSSASNSASNGAHNSVGVTPLGDRVLVKAISAEDFGSLTAFGIVMPDSSKEKPEQGVVVAVGLGKRNEDGDLMPLSVTIGDRIMFSKYGFDEIKVAGVEYLILPESSILAIIEN